MKFAKRLAASIMTAAIGCSVLGTAAGAVDFSVINDGSSNTPSQNSSTQTSLPASTVQNAVTEKFDGCIKFSWSPVKGVSRYALKICNANGIVEMTAYFNEKVTAVVIPESEFDLGNEKSKDFYACVIPLLPGETDSALRYYYAPVSSKFTLEEDLSIYPKYGAAQDIIMAVKNGTLYVTWRNPNDFATKKDLFNIEVVDNLQKSVFSKTTPDNKVEIKDLKDGQSYTFKVYNKTFSAMVTKDFTFTSDVKKEDKNENQAVETPVKKEKKLAAPASFKAKAADSSITLSWKKVDGADGYRIYKYNSKTKKYERYKTVKGTKLTLKNLKNGTTYKFRIAAVRYDKTTKKYIAGTVSSTVKASPKK